MTRAYSIAFKQKLIERLTGKEALSATKLGRESGVSAAKICRDGCVRRVAFLRWPPIVQRHGCGPSSRRLRYSPML